MESFRADDEELDDDEEWEDEIDDSIELERHRREVEERYKRRKAPSIDSEYSNDKLHSNQQLQTSLKINRLLQESNDHIVKQCMDHIIKLFGGTKSLLQFISISCFFNSAIIFSA